MDDKKKKPGLHDYLDSTTKLIAAITALITAAVGLTTLLVRLDGAPDRAADALGPGIVAEQPPSAPVQREYGPANPSSRPGPQANPQGATVPVDVGPRDSDAYDWWDSPTGPVDAYIPPAYVPPQAAPATPALGSYCCDVYGFRRCMLVTPLALSEPCFCPYQGTGFVCP
jgi:hypothetical protein